VDTVRTFGQLIAHITDSYNYFCAHGVGNKVEWTTPIEKGATDKDTLLPKLKEAVGRCNAAYSSGNAQLRPLFTNIGHTSLHYGNIITYMRMMGLKPPSSLATDYTDFIHGFFFKSVHEIRISLWLCCVSSKSFCTTCVTASDCWQRIPVSAS
jgi:hypothetical protein